VDNREKIDNIIEKKDILDKENVFIISIDYIIFLNKK